VNTLELAWYAVLTKPKQEERAAVNLVGYGIETFLPMARRAGRQRASSGTAPLFPRYLFVKCSMEALAPKIRYVRGISKVLGTEVGPTSVDESIIAAIQSRIGKDGTVQLTSLLEVGDHVEIISGPLKGFTGVFNAITTASERVILLLKAVSGQVRVSVNCGAIEKLSD
jgi:transcriptional antiterminator RfaH